MCFGYGFSAVPRPAMPQVAIILGQCQDQKWLCVQNEALRISWASCNTCMVLIIPNWIRLTFDTFWTHAPPRKDPQRHTNLACAVKVLSCFVMRLFWYLGRQSNGLPKLQVKCSVYRAEYHDQYNINIIYIYITNNNFQLKSAKNIQGNTYWGHFPGFWKRRRTKTY